MIHPASARHLMNKRRAMNGARHVCPESFRHVCVIVSVHAEILAIGYNQVRPGLETSIHAEADAFMRAREAYRRKGGNRRIKVDVYVFRDNGLCSRPCLHCTLDWLQHNPLFKVRYVYYSDQEQLVRATVDELLVNAYISGGHRKAYYMKLN